MPDLPTRADLFRIGADEVLLRSESRPAAQRISPSQVYTDGSDINVIIASASAMAEEVTRQLALRINALFIDGATGEDLDRLVGDRFSPTIVRKSATPSLGTVQLTRVAGLFPLVTLPIGTQLTTASGVQFETTVVATVPAGSSGPVSVPIRARQAGLAGNVAALAINAFVNPPSDPDLQVSNPAPTAGGDEVETDARLRARARDFFRTARRGTLAAIEFGALTVPGVRQATAVEEVDSLGIPTGRVSLYVADALGQANAALVLAVQAALLEYRAAGVYVDVSSSIPLFVPIQYLLRFAAGVDTTAAFARVQAATVSAVNALAPNATLPVSLLFSVARSVPGVIVLDDAVVTPVGDLVPSAGQIIRTRTDLVTAV